MSLAATHIRFALALCADLGVADSEKFVSGAVYPDTRYATRIRRRLTHDFGYFSGKESLDDFEKGWLAHLVGDRVFQLIVEERFPDLVLEEEYGSRRTTVTALKIIQDIHDAQSFDIGSVLPYLDYYEVRFREDERLLLRFHDSVRRLYAGRKKPAAEDYLLFWADLGMTPAELGRLKKRLVGFYGDADLVARIGGNFEDGMELYRRLYREKVRLLDLRDFARTEE